MSFRVYIAVVVLVGAATAFFSEVYTSAHAYVPKPECGLAIEDLHKTVVWYTGANRMELSTKMACGYAPTQIYDLTEATLTVLSAGRILFKAHSKEARWAVKQNQLLLNSPSYENTSLTMGKPSYLLVHLKKGEVIFPGGKFDLNDRINTGRF